MHKDRHILLLSIYRAYFLYCIVNAPSLADICVLLNASSSQIMAINQYIHLFSDGCFPRAITQIATRWHYSTSEKTGSVVFRMDWLLQSCFNNLTQFKHKHTMSVFFKWLIIIIIILKKLFFIIIIFLHIFNRFTEVSVNVKGKIYMIFQFFSLSRYPRGMPHLFSLLCRAWPWV